MVTPIQAAQRAGLAAAAAIAGEAITYSRGALSISIAQAIRGQTSWDATAPFNGVRVGDKSTDFCILAALVVNGSGVVLEPARGDTITVDGRSFRVMPFGPDAQLWQWHDVGRTVYRIHTKERTAT